MGTSQLILIHLSDIHFRKASSFDLDEELRHELVRDAKRVADQVGPAEAILVSGDIAFSGKTEEYEVARAWLEELCAASGSTIEKVRVIPGNHDVDRSKLGSPILEDARNRLRELEFDDMNRRLRLYLEDSVSSDLLLRPIENYNHFAGPLNCDIRPDKLWWEEDLPLNDGSTLRLRGLHSALLSEPCDSDLEDRRKMIVGASQVAMRREDGVAFLVMCHHPPQWLRHADNVERSLNALSSIQLFGHKHMHELFVRDGKSLRLAAGAVHPDRSERYWDPRYNVLCLSVADTPQGRVLRAEVRLRVWNRDRLEFQADSNKMAGSDHAVYELKLANWQGRLVAPNSSCVPAQNATSDGFQSEQEFVEGDLPSMPPADLSSSALQAAGTADNVQGEKAIKGEVASTAMWSGETTMDAKRKLAYKYFTLPYVTIMRIALQLDLVRDEDEAITDNNERYRRFLARAEELRLLGKLWEAVASHRNDLQGENPFEV